MLESTQFTSPPPGMPNMAVPPPTRVTVPISSLPTPDLSVPPPMGYNRYTAALAPHTPPKQHFFTPFRPYPRPGLDPEFDGKRLRKSVMRKTVDYNAAIIKMLETRVWQRDFRDRRALQPDVLYYPDMQPPRSYEDNAMNAVTTRFVKTATNKMRCPVFCMAWTPEGRRLVTGASSGEFTLWNGLTFNFETILQAHDSPVRTMMWSHNEQWMVTADHAGYVKYWQSNMNNVKMFQGHKEAVRGISFSPSDAKFATCSDDGTIRVWDFLRCQEERILRGHGADVKCVDWHPQKGLIVSGSKDNQQPVKLWDPKTGQSLATLHAHKSTVMDVKWNSNGNWLVTASRDHLLKLFDIRQLGQELQTFRGHKKESSSVAWHPYHEGLFASGGSDGAILFWHVGADKEVGAIEQAHDSIVWTLAWHPLGHILCSGSNDHTSKFWTRNRPGDQMRDKYNLNNMPAGLTGLEEVEQDDQSVIPGMGPEDRVEAPSHETPDTSLIATNTDSAIPGLDFDVEDKNKPLSKKGLPAGLRWNAVNIMRRPKVPYSKPIPRNFQAQWNDTARPNMDDENGEDDHNGDLRDADQDAIAKMIQQLVEKVPGVVPVNDLEPTALFMYGKVLPVTPDSVLARTINGGSEAIYRLINCGAIEDLTNDIAHDESTQYRHEDPSVDNELRALKAYELPRRPPLLSTPNMPPQKLGPERGRGRGRGRERGRSRGRGRNEDMDDEDSYHSRSQDDGLDDYDDQEDDYYEGQDEDDTEEIHQRFMGEEEEMYNAMLDHDSNHTFPSQDYRERIPSASVGDQDLRIPQPSLLGVAPGIPGGTIAGSNTGVLGRAPPGFMKDQDLRRSSTNQADRDPRLMHMSPHGRPPHLADQDLRSSPSNFSGMGSSPSASEGRDFRRQPRQPLLGDPKFPPQSHYGSGSQDADYRKKSDDDGRYSGRRSHGSHYRNKEDYEEGEKGQDEEYPHSRSGRGRGRGGHWSSSSHQEMDEEDDSKSKWSSHGRSPGPFPGRGMHPSRGGPSAPWEHKRGRGLLETPRGGLLATPVMEPKEDDNSSYHPKRSRWAQEAPWDEEAGQGEAESALEEGEEVDFNHSSNHRGSYRGRGGWGGGGGGYPQRAMWGGRGRGRGTRSGHPRGGRRPRGRN